MYAQGRDTAIKSVPKVYVSGCEPLLMLCLKYNFAVSCSI